MSKTIIILILMNINISIYLVVIQGQLRGEKTREKNVKDS